MSTTAELLLDELEAAAKDLLKFGEHEGSCTNEKQVAVSQRIPACKRHLAAMKSREDRFVRSLESLKLLRGVFGSSGDL